VTLDIIQRELGHVNIGTTCIYLQGTDIQGINKTAGDGEAVRLSNLVLLAAGQA
jgi:hypothetical protein